MHRYRLGQRTRGEDKASGSPAPGGGLVYMLCSFRHASLQIYWGTCNKMVMREIPNCKRLQVLVLR